MSTGSLILLVELLHEDPVSKTRVLQGLGAWYTILWALLAISPYDRQDWLLENLLALAAVIALLVSHRWFEFTTPSYVLLTGFLTLHAVGSHYTYAEVPFGHWLQRTFDLTRNPFDRLIHFSYGLLLVYPLHELLVRLAGVRGLWSYYLSVSGVVAQSGFFELIEAVVAHIVNPELGSAYLGTQGDEWDAQKDMGSALAGALITIVAVSLGERYHWLPGIDKKESLCLQEHS